MCKNKCIFVVKIFGREIYLDEKLLGKFFFIKDRSRSFRNDDCRIFLGRSVFILKRFHARQFAKWEIRSKNNYRDVAGFIKKKKKLFLLLSGENKKGLQIIPIRDWSFDETVIVN